VGRRLRAGHVQYNRKGMPNACPEKDTYQQKVNARDFVLSVLDPVEQPITIIPANR